MKIRDMVIFFVVVFVIYFSANSYIFIKGYRALTGHFSLFIYSATFIVLASFFIVGKILERSSSSVIVDVLNVAGGFWLAFMLYSFLLLLISDIAIAGGRIAGIIETGQLPVIRYYSYLFVLIVSSVIIISGFINSVMPVEKRYSLEINSETISNTPVRIVAVSDVHLGSVVRRRSLRELSAMINRANPDIIFFLGDLVDGEINPVLRDDLLSSLSLPDNGAEVIAITGNHEFIGGIGQTLPYLENSGLNVLSDDLLVLKSGIQVIGRTDRDSFRYYGKRRKALSELLELTDPDRPVIILDHQPPGKNEVIGGNFDLMLSGHTHNGQMWPFSYIVRSIFKTSYGLSTDGRRNFIVSSGFGTWGPRVRIGSRSEIVIIDLSFKKSD